MTNPELSNDQPLSPEEITQTAELLRRLPPGRLPLEIFIETARLIPQPTVEVAPLRTTDDGRVEVFMTQRSEDDSVPEWRGAWHMPGTVLLASDEAGSFDSSFQRIHDDELYGMLTFEEQPKYTGIMKFWDIPRGRELDQLHYVEVGIAPGVQDEADLPGRFFDVNNLPENTLAHHKVMLPEIVAVYQGQKSA